MVYTVCIILRYTCSDLGTSSNQTSLSEIEECLSQSFNNQLVESWLLQPAPHFTRCCWEAYGGFPLLLASSARVAGSASCSREAIERPRIQKSLVWSIIETKAYSLFNHHQTTFQFYTYPLTHPPQASPIQHWCHRRARLVIRHKLHPWSLWGWDIPNRGGESRLRYVEASVLWHKCL